MILSFIILIFLFAIRHLKYFVFLETAGRQDRRFSSGHQQTFYIHTHRHVPAGRHLREHRAQHTQFKRGEAQGFVSPDMENKHNGDI